MGGIYDFLEKKKLESLQELEKKTETPKQVGAETPSTSESKLSYEARKELNRQIKRQEKLVAESEHRIEELEQSIADLEARLATPEGASDTSLYTQYAEQKQALAETMDQWTEQTLQLEEMKGA